MLSKWILIRNSVGLHARPVFQLATAASDYESDIRICHHGLTADTKNSARLLALGINTGEVVHLIVDGIDEAPAFERISSIFNEINKQ